MKQLPRLTLRIGLLEVLVKGKVRQILQTGGIVTHHIVRSREVLDQVTVALLALEKTRVVAEVGAQPVRGYCALGFPRDSRCIVTEIQHRSIGSVMGRRLEGDLSQQGRLLQVAVG